MGPCIEFEFRPVGRWRGLCYGAISSQAIFEQFYLRHQQFQFNGEFSTNHLHEINCYLARNRTPVPEVPQRKCENQNIGFIKRIKNQNLDLEPAVLLDVGDAVLLVADPLHRVLSAEPLHQRHRRPGKYSSQQVQLCSYLVRIGIKSKRCFLPVDIPGDGDLVEAPQDDVVDFHRV